MNTLSQEFDKGLIYQLLEQKFLTYQELVTIPVSENNEPYVSLRNSGIKFIVYTDKIPASTNDEIYVRQGILDRLHLAQNWLTQQSPDHRLTVFYGYRSPAVQQASFERQANSLGFSLPLNLEQTEAVQRFIAAPEIAGHPTGGAVDITLSDSFNRLADMGTPLHGLEEDSYTFSPFINKEAWQNRQLLRAAMMAAGFAPFDGEWWHFSYGDREWAKYWNQPKAIYSQKEL